MLDVTLAKKWTTHMGVLVRVLHLSEGDVVELGAGPASTPLMHWVCKDMNRNLITYENNPDYYEFARQYQSRLHRIRFVNNWDEIDTKTHRGLVFVDHHPNDRRGPDTVRFKYTADYIVIHDSDASSYNYSIVWSNFKYIYTWEGCRPWTSVLSNFKDLTAL